MVRRSGSVRSDLALRLVQGAPSVLAWAAVWAAVAAWNGPARAAGGPPPRDVKPSPQSRPGVFLDNTFQLLGTQVVPPINSLGSGQGSIRVNTIENELHFDFTYSDLEGRETAVDLHGPAPRGANAGVLFTLVPTSPNVGTWKYPESLEADILAGRTYVDIHTVRHPNGELRGQIEPFTRVKDVPLAGPWGVLGIAVVLAGAGARRAVARRVAAARRGGR